MHKYYVIIKNILPIADLGQILLHIIEEDQVKVTYAPISCPETILFISSVEKLRKENRYLEHNDRNKSKRNNINHIMKYFWCITTKNSKIKLLIIKKSKQITSSKENNKL